MSQDIAYVTFIFDLERGLLIKTKVPNRIYRRERVTDVSLVTTNEVTQIQRQTYKVQAFPLIHERVRERSQVTGVLDEVLEGESFTHKGQRQLVSLCGIDKVCTVVSPVAWVTS